MGHAAGVEGGVDGALLTFCTLVTWPGVVLLTVLTRANSIHHRACRSDMNPRNLCCERPKRLPISIHLSHSKIRASGGYST